MPINIPTIINELRENTTEEQRKGLSILENRFYECIELKKENVELVQKIHILNEANMNLENTVGELGEQLKEANELLLGFLDENICSFDHNGYCQEHSSTEPDYKCIQQQLKWYLKKHKVLK